MAYKMTNERLVAIRRALHQIPEPGFQEFKTQNMILSELSQMDSENKLEIKRWKSGIFVRIPGTEPVKTIGYRADIDGLPMKEKTGLSFTSTHEEMMHACGHDFHMTIALGLIANLLNHKLINDVVVIFQPAEEGPGGALPILESVEFKPFRPDEIYSLHIAPELKAGVVSTKPGTLFANTSELFIDLKGKGGHAAFPHLTEDMAVAASHLVTQLQSIVARNIAPLDSAVVTIGKMTAGTKQNIIADSARIEGTIRTLSDETMNDIKSRIEGIMAGIEASFRCTASIDYGSNYCQVYNNERLTTEFMEQVQQQNSAKLHEAGIAMTGEDFGYFLRDIPGMMCWLGVDSATGLHTTTLNPNESALVTGVNVFTKWILYRDQFE